MAGLEAQPPFDLFRRDVVGAVIVGRRGLDGHLLFADRSPDHLGKGGHRVVLVARVEDLARDAVVGVLERAHVEVRDVLDVDVGALLPAAEDGDSPVVHRVVGQDVHGQVEAEARGIAAHGGGAEHERGEAGGLRLQQHVLAEGLVLGVVGERRQGQLLGNVLLVLDPVHARAGGVDESPDPLVLRDLHEGREGVVIDGLAQDRIELEARIVRDAGEVDHRVHPRELALEQPAVTNVPSDLTQTGMPLDRVEDMLPEDVQIDHGHPVPGGEELRHQHGSDVSGPAGDQDMLSRRLH